MPPNASPKMGCLMFVSSIGHQFFQTMCLSEVAVSWTGVGERCEQTLGIASLSPRLTLLLHPSQVPVCLVLFPGWLRAGVSGSRVLKLLCLGSSLPAFSVSQTRVILRPSSSYPFLPGKLPVVIWVERSHPTGSCV